MLGARCLRGISVGVRWNSSLVKIHPNRLKSWQEDAVQACVNAVHAGLPKIGVQLIAGAKKSRSWLLLHLMERLPPRTPDATQLLVVVASVKRAEKFAEDLKLFCDESFGQPTRAPPPHISDGSKWNVEVDRKNLTQVSNADIFLTTYQDMMKERVGKRLNTSKLKAVYLDQAHTARSEFYELLMSRITSDSGPPPVIGVSRAWDDVLGPMGVFDDIVYRRRITDPLQEEECRARFSAALIPPLGKIRVVSDKTRFETKALSTVMSRPPVLDATVQAWRDMAATRKSTLVYCADRAHAEKLAAAFQKAEITARAKTMRTPRSMRVDKNWRKWEDLLAEFKAGQFRILAVPRAEDRIVGMPWVDCVLIASPTLTMDKEALWNMMNPAMKGSDGKEDTLIIEVMAEEKSPDSFDLRRLLGLKMDQIDGRPLSELRQVAEEDWRRRFEEQKAKLALKKHQPPPPPLIPESNVCQLPASPALLQQAHDEAADRGFRIANEVPPKKRWVRSAPGVYVRDCLQHGHVILRKVDMKGSEVYEAFWTPRQLESEEAPSEPAKKLSAPGNIKTVAIRINRFLEPKKEVMKDRELKATELQLAALRRFCPPTMAHVVRDGKPMARDDFIEWLTTGDASTALGRLRYNSDFPDGSGFTYKEQTAIVARIRQLKRPWEALFKKKADIEAARAKKRADKAARRAGIEDAAQKTASED
ncbi:hypothetical protein DFH07DRAFT_965864 [Mycena maculata]|uniref:Uncharacterized protein n=1 Tax=Mycena maculata TaxID=230809 RepID=A0AAD7ICB4_9AGAR|nr:hypothetical protein DFH07DRAFT_965864 [Mycena maculata]